jgi:DNA-binding CsgD family transcriptional regulator
MRVRAPVQVEHIDVPIGGAVVRQSIRVHPVQLVGGLHGQTTTKIRYFVPGTEVVNYLVEQMIQDARAGDLRARVQLPTYIMAGHLKQPTYRYITATTLFKAGLVPRRCDAFQYVDRAVDGALPKMWMDDDLETTLMKQLVGVTPSHAQELLPQVKVAQRTLLKEIWPADRKIYAQARPSVMPQRGLAPFERVGRHRIRSLIRAKLGGSSDLERLTALRMTSERQALIDRANRMTLDALVRDERITPEEERAYRFWHLKRRSPVRVTDGIWFDGIVWESPYLRSLLLLSPAVHHRLVGVAFMRAWPPDLLATAQADLRHHLEALLKVGGFLLNMVRDESKSRMAANAVRPVKTLARLSTKQQQLAAIAANKQHVTRKQWKAAKLKIDGMSTKDVAETLGISRQGVEKLLAAAHERVTLRNKGFGGNKRRG